MLLILFAIPNNVYVMVHSAIIPISFNLLKNLLINLRNPIIAFECCFSLQLSFETHKILFNFYKFQVIEQIPQFLCNHFENKCELTLSYFIRYANANM